MLNIAFNSMCGGFALDDIELRRNDQAFLDALRAKSIPDPTTAGDFCRRFNEGDIMELMSDRAAEKRRPCPPRPRQYTERQLGLHDHGLTRLDAEGVDGPVAACPGALGRQTPR